MQLQDPHSLQKTVRYKILYRRFSYKYVIYPSYRPFSNIATLFKENTKIIHTNINILTTQRMTYTHCHIHSHINSHKLSKNMYTHNENYMNILSLSFLLLLKIKKLKFIDAIIIICFIISHTFLEEKQTK